MTTEYGVRWPNGEVEEVPDLARARAVVALHRTTVIVQRVVTRSCWSEVELS